MAAGSLEQLESQVAAFLDRDFEKEYGEERAKESLKQGEKAELERQEEEQGKQEAEKRAVRQRLQQIQVFLRGTQQQRASLFSQVDKEFLACTQVLKERQKRVKAKANLEFARSFTKALTQAQLRMPSCSPSPTPPALSPSSSSLASSLPFLGKMPPGQRDRETGKGEGEGGGEEKEKKPVKKSDEVLETKLKRFPIAFWISEKQRAVIAKFGTLVGGQASAEKCRIVGSGLESVIRDEETKFQIVTYNAKGRRLRTGGETSFGLTFYPKEAAVTYQIVDHQTGVYSVSYILHSPTDLSHLIVSVWLSAQRIGRPKSVSVHSGVPSFVEEKGGKWPKETFHSLASSWHTLFHLNAPSAYVHVSVSRDPQLIYVLRGTFNQVCVYTPDSLTLVHRWDFPYPKDTAFQNYLAAGRSCVAIGKERLILLFSPLGELQHSIKTKRLVNGLAIWECQKSVLVVEGLQEFLSVFSFKTGHQLQSIFLSPFTLYGVSTWDTHLAICGPQFVQLFRWENDKFLKIRSWEAKDEEEEDRIMDICLFQNTLFAITSEFKVRVLTF